MTVGPNVNISKLTGNQAESTISINPTNPLNLFESDTVSTATMSTPGHFSIDGGETWYASDMSALPDSLGDVQTTWDSFGNLFLTQIGVLDGALDTPSLSVEVGLSTDGGRSFTLLGNPVPETGYDQPSIAVGPGSTPGSGSVWVSVTVTNSSNQIVQIVAAGTPVTCRGKVGAFHSPEVAPGPGGGFGSIAVGPNGQVMVDYQDNNSDIGPDTIKVNLDPDGLGPAGFNRVVIATRTKVGGLAPIPAQPSRTIDAEANLAWDRSGGPHNGRVYMVYTDRPSTSSTDTDIKVRFSDNNGATWSIPTRVNDDDVGDGKSQFLPAIAVDQATGDVAVTWYDTRNSGADNNTTQVFGSASLDGGATWLANAQISTGTSNASAVDPGFDYGDYDLMDFHNGVFYRTWADNSNSTGDNPDGTSSLDIYTAKVSISTPPTVTPLLTVDDGDPLFETTGPGWKVVTGSGYQGDHRDNTTGKGNRSAHWHLAFPDLGQFVVYATWVPDPSNSSDAPYTIRDAKDFLQTVTVDQTKSPELSPGAVFVNGTWWAPLGTFTKSTRRELQVVLNVVSGCRHGKVDADAVFVAARPESAGASLAANGSSPQASSHSPTSDYSYGGIARQKFDLLDVALLSLYGHGSEGSDPSSGSPDPVSTASTIDLLNSRARASAAR